MQDIGAEVRFARKPVAHRLVLGATVVLEQDTAALPDDQAVQVELGGGALEHRRIEGRMGSTGEAAGQSPCQQ